MPHEEAGRDARPSLILTLVVSWSALVAWGVVLPGSASAASAIAPKRIADSGTIVYCSDMTSPPIEFLDENTKPVGSDLDIGNEMAKRFGVKDERKSILYERL